MDWAPALEASTSRDAGSRRVRGRMIIPSQRGRAFGTGVAPLRRVARTIGVPVMAVVMHYGYFSLGQRSPSARPGRLASRNRLALREVRSARNDPERKAYPGFPYHVRPKKGPGKQ